MTVHPFPPYWMEVESGRPDGSTIKRIAGRDYTMLETMAQALNFSISVMPDADWEEARQLFSLAHFVIKRTLNVNSHTVQIFFFLFLFAYLSLNVYIYICVCIPVYIYKYIQSSIY